MSCQIGSERVTLFYSFDSFAEAIRSRHSTPSLSQTEAVATDVWKQSKTIFKHFEKMWAAGNCGINEEELRHGPVQYWVAGYNLLEDDPEHGPLVFYLPVDSNSETKTLSFPPPHALNMSDLPVTVWNHGSSNIEAALNNKQPQARKFDDLQGECLRSKPVANQTDQTRAAICRVAALIKTEHAFNEKRVGPVVHAMVLRRNQPILRLTIP